MVSVFVMLIHVYLYHEYVTFILCNLFMSSGSYYYNWDIFKYSAKATSENESNTTLVGTIIMTNFDRSSVLAATYTFQSI